MVVDDEVPMLQLMERILLDRGDVAVTTVANSLEVPELLSVRPYDLVITDLRMPGLSGIDILQLIQERKRGEAAIVITAFGELKTALAAYQLGASDYITKPFTRERINTAVDHSLELRRIGLTAKRYEELMAVEPFSAAAAKFKSSYVVRLAAQSGANVPELAARSGIEPEIIQSVLNPSSNKSKG